MKLSACLLFIVLMCLAPAIPQARAQQPPPPAEQKPLLTVKAIRGMSPAQIARERPVARAQGVVTLHATNYPWFFIQDATGGLMVEPANKAIPALHPGDVVSVEGPVVTGMFGPYIGRATFSVTGRGPLPEPDRASTIQLCDGSHFGDFVEVENTVVRVREGQGETWLDLVFQGSGMYVIVQDAKALPPVEKLIGAKIRARGVNWPQNDRFGGHVRLSDASQLTITGAAAVFTPPGAAWWVLPGAGGAALVGGIAWLRLRRLTEEIKGAKRFRLLYERSPDATLMFDQTNGRFLDCNEAALKLFVAERKWIVGRAPWELAPELQPDGVSSREKGQEIIERAVRAGSLLFEWQHCRADGTDFPAEISVTIIDMEDVTRWVCVVRDVTARKDAEAALRAMNLTLERQVSERTSALVQAQQALRDSEEKFRLLVEGASDAMGLLDPVAGRIVHYNAAAVALFGASSREHLMNAHPWEISPEFQPGGQPSKDKAAHNIQTALVHGAHRFEWLHQRFDQSLFTTEVSLTTAIMGDRKMVIFLIRDITAHKRAEEEMQRNLAREKELGDLKSNFVSMVSHEFRTPLGVISSSAQILDRYITRLDEEERREHLRAITSSVKRMAGMMEDVLVLSRVDSGRMDFAPTPLALGELCRRLQDESISAHGGEVQLTVAPEAEAPVPADEKLIRHILTNLLANARKYSPPESPVEMALSRDGSDAVITVRDHGIGVPEADQARLFEAFHRGSNVGHIHGTGLGLVIVRRCCERHGGSVSVTSEEGKGAIFTVRLPVFAT